MSDKRYNKWLIWVYSALALVGIIIIIVLALTSVAPWGTLYAWLVGVPFGLVAITSYTFIPKILMKYATKKTQHSRVIAFLGVLLYVTRYLFYLIPLLIVVGANGFQIDGIFNVYGVIAIIILIPLCGVGLNFALFRIDLKKMPMKGEKNVASGDSLSPN